MKKVLVTNLIMQRDLDQFKLRLNNANIEPVSYPVKQFLKEDELLSIINQYDGVIAGDDEFTEKVLKAGLPRLRVISKWGVGLDSIDLEAAKKFGIKVYNSKGAFGKAVAEVAMGYVLMMSRKLHLIDQEVRKGRWPKIEVEGLDGKVLGIIGFGFIGRETAKRAQGFGMKILAHDILMEETEAPNEVSFCSFDEVLKKSDYLCLACNLTPESRGMIGEKELLKMKRSACIINVSRGGIIDEDALIGGLVKKGIAGAALDVYEEEPISPQHPLTKMKNVVLGSHNANNIRSANDFVNKNSIKNLLKGLKAA